MFVEYLGHPENFETEWTIFDEYLKEEQPSDESEIRDFLQELVDNLDPEMDEEPASKKRLKAAIKAANELLNK